MKSKQYAQLAFDAICKLANQGLAGEDNSDLPMDGDFTEDISKSFLKMLNKWQGNK